MAVVAVATMLTVVAAIAAAASSGFSIRSWFTKMFMYNVCREYYSCGAQS